MALEITARFEGLTWGDLRKLVELATHEGDDDEVLYTYDEGAQERCGILVFASASDLGKKEGPCHGCA